MGWIAAVSLGGSLFAANAPDTHEPGLQPPGEKAGLSGEAKALVEKGIRSCADGKLDDAYAAFQSFLKVAPNNLTGLVNLGVIEYRRKHPAEAERLLKSAVRIDLDNAPAWLTLGMLYYEQSKYDDALAALSRSALVEPKNAVVHNYLAATIGAKGWTDGAELELQKALELDPAYGEAHFNLAVLYLQRNPPAIELARRHYARARDLGQPADPLVEKTLDEAK
jgi:tetratricopeptide (TPR) repeat protein